MSEIASVAILASCLRLAILPHGRVPILRDGLLHFLYRHGILLLLSEGLSPLLPELFDGIAPSILAFKLVREWATVLLVSEPRICTLDHGGNCMSLLSNIAHLLSIDSSHFPLNVGFLSFFTLGYCSFLNYFVSDSEFSSFDLREVLHMSSIWNSSFAICFEQSLDHTKPRQSEAEQSPAILTCAILQGSLPWEFHLLIIELGPIERRNLERRHSASVY